MHIKDKTFVIRDKISGLSRIYHKLDELELKSDVEHSDVINSLADLRNMVNGLYARTNPVQTVRIDGNTILTKIFTGIKMYLNPNDVSVAAHIAVDGFWEYQISKAWLAVVKQDDIVFDIGANFGYFGLLAGQFTDKKKSKVVLFEANIGLIPYINKSLSVNWLHEQTTVENLAVSDSIGEVSLNIPKDYIGSSSIKSIEELDSLMHGKMSLELEEVMTVKSTTIDFYCKNNNIKELNLIKMDIEGYEEKAYSGMKNIVKRSKNITLFIEFTKELYDDPNKFYSTMLEDFGHVYTINNQGLITKPENTSYESVICGTDDWVMPIFSKNANLDEEQNVVV